VLLERITEAVAQRTLHDIAGRTQVDPTAHEPDVTVRSASLEPPALA
jgi:hypothetical protein